MARRLAERLHWDWLDADDVLEARFGRSIRLIFADEGEVGFRAKESAVLDELCSLQKQVIATGGGVLLLNDLRDAELLAAVGASAWLHHPSLGVGHLQLTSPACIKRRHQNRSTLMTSNRPIEEWGQLLGDVPAATAILDRFLQQAEVIPITGRSYRLRNQKDNSGLAAGKKR